MSATRSVDTSFREEKLDFKLVLSHGVNINCTQLFTDIRLESRESDVFENCDKCRRLDLIISVGSLQT
jgi:hypothetical protein